GPIACDAIVIAAGAWSRPLVQALDSDLPLDTERGYHLTLPQPSVTPLRPICSGDHSFTVTPLAMGLRFAGTVELAGLALPPASGRREIWSARRLRMLPGLRPNGASRSLALRPSMPDSLPVIARAPTAPNAVFAFGHGHLGVTLAAITGKLAAALALSRPPAL